MNKILFVCILLLLGFVSFDLCANSLNSDGVDITFVSFFKKIDSSVVNFNFSRNSSSFSYESGTDVKKANGFLAMGIVGTIIMVSGLVEIIAGAVCIAYIFIAPQTYSNSGGSFQDALSSGFEYLLSAYLMMYVGAILIAVGVVFFLIGLPLMIVGYSLNKKFRRTASIMFENDKEYLKFGLKLSL